MHNTLFLILNKFFVMLTADITLKYTETSFKLNISLGYQDEIQNKKINLKFMNTTLTLSKEFSCVSTRTAISLEKLKFTE